MSKRCPKCNKCSKEELKKDPKKDPEKEPKKKCCAGRVACLMSFSLILGCLIGVHKNVIKACIKGDALPEAPDWHIWCK